MEVLNYGFRKIYKIKVDDLNHEELLKEIQIDRDYIFGDLKAHINTDKNGVGLQYPLYLTRQPNLLNLSKACYNVAKDTYFSLRNKKYVSSYENSWVFISTPENDISHYHNHLEVSGFYRVFTADISWVYYIQIPDNCSGTEGKLIFTETPVNDFRLERSYAIMPEEGYIYLFDADLYHRVGLNPNSTKDRVVVAGNIHFNIE